MQSVHFATLFKMIRKVPGNAAPPKTPNPSKGLGAFLNLMSGVRASPAPPFISFMPMYLVVLPGQLQDLGQATCRLRLFLRVFLGRPGNIRPALANAELNLFAAKSCTRPHTGQEYGCTIIPTFKGAINGDIRPSAALGLNSTTGLLYFRSVTPQLGHRVIIRRIGKLLSISAQLFLAQRAERRASKYSPSVAARHR